MASPNAPSGRILLVGTGDGAEDVLAALHAESWECARSDKPSGVLRQIRTDSVVDLLLLAPQGPSRPYCELCRSIKFDKRTALVAVIFVLPPEDAEIRGEVFEAGADDCIQLPASPKEILVRLSNALRVKHTTDLLEDSTAVVTSLAAAIEGRDPYTHGHVERVSSYSVKIGMRVDMDAEGLATLKIGGIVHDIGKVSVPDQILNKRGKLNDLEMELIRRHPVVGYDILQPLRTFRSVLPIVRWHHERPNGKGYPDGLVGEKIPLLPRIVAVADYFDAISTARPYRPALSTSKCREILSTAAENEDLDPSLVMVLFNILSESDPAMIGVPDAAFS